MGAQCQAWGIFFKAEMAYPDKGDGKHLIIAIERTEMETKTQMQSREFRLDMQ